MKKAFITLCGILVLSCSVMAQQRIGEDVRPREKQNFKATNAKIEAIELIEGTPKRKFQKIIPVWVQQTTMVAAVKKAKKDAYKAGADAIIEFQFGSQASSGMAAVGGIMTGSSSSYPVVQGWAVKWID